MVTPAMRAQSHVGPAWRRFMPAPMATKSAATLRVLAMIKTPKSTATMDRPVRRNRFVANSPRPTPVASAVRSQISCTAAMSGKVNKAVHRKPRPCAAPAWAYVATPEGSSSDAPVTRPGPRIRRYWSQAGPAFFDAVVDFFVDLFLGGAARDFRRRLVLTA